MVMLQYCVGNFAVRNNLDGTVIVGQLLGGDEIGVVAVDGAIDTHDAAHLGGNRTDVVRHNNDSHTLAQAVEQFV